MQRESVCDSDRNRWDETRRWGRNRKVAKPEETETLSRDRLYRSVNLGVGDAATAERREDEHPEDPNCRMQGSEQPHAFESPGAGGSKSVFQGPARYEADHVPTGANTNV